MYTMLLIFNILLTHFNTLHHKYIFSFYNHFHCYLFCSFSCAANLSLRVNLLHSGTIQNNIQINQHMITCIMIWNCLKILFWCTKHEMNASLVVEINISRGCTWFSASNTGIKMQPFPTSSSSRNYSQYVYIDVVYTACCWNQIIWLHYSIDSGIIG